jgi:hypothetical protein
MRYIVYKGDDIRCMGTLDECIKLMGIKKSTFQYYLTPSHAHRVEQREAGSKRKLKGYTRVEPMQEYIQKKLNG